MVAGFFFLPFFNTRLQTCSWLLYWKVEKNSCRFKVRGATVLQLCSAVDYGHWRASGVKVVQPRVGQTQAHMARRNRK